MLRRLRVTALLVAPIAGGVLVWPASPARAVAVSKEAELKAAFATGTQIDVQADITLTDCTGGGAVERMAAVTDPVTVDGHAHTIRRTCADNVFDQEGPGLVTMRNLTIRGGHASGNGGGIFAAGPLTAENTTDRVQLRQCGRWGHRLARLHHAHELGRRFERQQWRWRRSLPRPGQSRADDDHLDGQQQHRRWDRATEYPR